MEPLFESSVREFSRLIGLQEKELALLEVADRAANELVVSEFEKYIERKFNDKVPEVLGKYHLLGVPISERYGGRGARQLLQALFMERLGQLGLGVITFADVHQCLGSLTIQDWGSEEQKNRYLTKAASGDAIFAYALTEPEAGSDPVSIKTTYSKDGRGFKVTGEKYLISNGSIASHLIVFAYPKGIPRGLTAFIVDSKEAGFSVDMKLEEKMGLFTSDTALLSFAGVRDPTEDMLGQEGKGLHVSHAPLLNGRLGVAS